MVYQDGNIARVGDVIELGNGEHANVVGCIDSGEYAEDYPKEEWEYLRAGIMVESSTMGLCTIRTTKT